MQGNCLPGHAAGDRIRHSQDLHCLLSQTDVDRVGEAIAQSIVDLDKCLRRG